LSACSELDHARAIIQGQEEELALHGLGPRVAPPGQWPRCLPGSSKYHLFDTSVAPFRACLFGYSRSSPEGRIVRVLGYH